MKIRFGELQFNKDEYAERVCDYVVAYACKGEISASGAVAMFEEMLSSDAVTDSTSFSCLAQVCSP